MSARTNCNRVFELRYSMKFYFYCRILTSSDEDHLEINSTTVHEHIEESSILN